MIVTKSFLSGGLDTLVTFNPISISPDTSLRVLLERLYTTGFHHWPVVDEDQVVVGMVSDLDIIHSASESWAAGAAISETAAEVPVSSFMRRPVITVDSEGTPLEGLRTIVENGFGSVPVIHKGKLWGMVTISDYVREFAHSSHSTRTTPVASIMERSPIQIGGDDTLEMVQQYMLIHQARYAVVMEGECPIGVISARDIRQRLCRVMAHSAISQTDASQVRAAELVKLSVSVSPQSNMGEASITLYEHQTQAAMVCSRGNELRGLITQEQMMALLYHAENEQDISLI